MEEALLLGERAIGERDSARADLDKLVSFASCRTLVLVGHFVLHFV